MKIIIDCFVVLVFVISSQIYWSKVYILQILKKKLFDRKLIFFLTKKGTHIVNLKKAKTDSCHRTTFYSIFNMSSSRKPEVYTKDLPKITIIKWICYFLTTVLFHIDVTIYKVWYTSACAHSSHSQCCIDACRPWYTVVLINIQCKYFLF